MSDAMSRAQEDYLRGLATDWREKNERQAARIAQLEAQVADFIEQANTKCACAHDRPEDVCLAHSPIVAKQADRIAQLEAALREANETIKWMCEKELRTALEERT